MVGLANCVVTDNACGVIRIMPANRTKSFIISPSIWNAGLSYFIIILDPGLIGEVGNAEMVVTL